VKAPGAFITFEGGEGAGKSTAARALAAYLREAGREVVLTREPGGTPGAEAIRALLLDPASCLTPRADTLLHFAARADHVESLIRPALTRGAVVISDRFYDSTTAYQGYGMGMDLQEIAALVRQIGLCPDLTFILQLDDATAKYRLKLRGDTADRYDLMGSAFMAKIAAGFRTIAAAEPVRCVLVDASPPPIKVFETICGIVVEKLQLP
jgi:dTMP kinase